MDQQGWSRAVAQNHACHWSHTLKPRMPLDGDPTSSIYSSVNPVNKLQFQDYASTCQGLRRRPPKGVKIGPAAQSRYSGHFLGPQWPDEASLLIKDEHLCWTLTLCAIICFIPLSTSTSAWPYKVWEKPAWHSLRYLQRQKHTEPKDGIYCCDL